MSNESDPIRRNDTRDIYEVTLALAGGAKLILHSYGPPTWSPGNLKAKWVETVAFIDTDSLIALSWQPVTP